MRYPIIKLISVKVATNTGTDIPVKGTHFCLTSSGVEPRPVLVNDGIVWAFITVRGEGKDHREIER